MSTIFSQQILNNNLLLIDKNVISIVDPNYTKNRLSPRMCYCWENVLFFIKDKRGGRGLA